MAHCSLGKALYLAEDKRLRVRENLCMKNSDVRQNPGILVNDVPNGLHKCATEKVKSPSKVETSENVFNERRRVKIKMSFPVPPS